MQTEETIELELLMNQLPMQKKRLQAYLVGHPLYKSALTEKGTVNKSSIMLRLLIIRTVESIPESLKEDVNQLKEALDLCNKVSEYNKIIRELYKAISHQLEDRIVALAERYESTLSELESETMEYETKVKTHLERMGFKW